MKREVVSTYEEASEKRKSNDRHGGQRCRALWTVGVKIGVQA